MATHASANDEYPDYSYLAFSQGKDSSESNILYIKDQVNTYVRSCLLSLSLNKGIEPKTWIATNKKFSCYLDVPIQKL